MSRVLDGRVARVVVAARLDVALVTTEDLDTCSFPINLISTIDNLLFKDC